MSQQEDCNKSPIEHELQLLTHEISRRAQQFNRELLATKRLFADKQNFCEDPNEERRRGAQEGLKCHTCNPAGAMQRVVQSGPKGGPAPYELALKPWRDFQDYLRSITHPNCSCSCSSCSSSSSSNSCDFKIDCSEEPKENHRYEIIVLGVELEHYVPCCEPPSVELPIHHDHYVVGVHVRALVRDEDPLQHMHDYSSKSSSSNTARSGW